MVDEIVEALAKLWAPKYILRITVEVLLGRRGYCDSDDELLTIICGVPESSALGPLLCS